MNTSESIDFSTLDTLQIEAALHEIIIRKLHEKYGAKPCKEISQRVEEEWKSMELTDTVLDIAALYELTIWLQENRVPYLARGLCGSGFILYLLGITYGNPLPPHSYCPKCKTVHFEEKYKDGFDITQNVCENDNTPLIGDGHNIPWQTLWGYGDFCPSFQINLPQKFFDEMKIKAKNHWLNKHPYKSDAIFGWSFEREVYSIELRNLEFFFNLETNSASDISIGHEDSDFIMQSLNDERIIAKEYRLECLDEKTELKSVADVIYLVGLYHSDGVLEPAVEMIERGYSPSDMIAFRDDVYSYLIKWRFFEKDAWKWANMVRKGMKMPVVTKPMKNADDSWVIDFCSHCRYLCIKSDVVERLLFVAKDLKNSLQ